ncbi:MAG TPA: hypothetical protein VF105_02935 [Gemmatimonadaceae bacterium]
MAVAKRTSARRTTGNKPSPARQIASFLAKYDPKVAAAAKASRTRLRKIVPGGTEFVYDNYNALVFGYGPSERPSEAVLSLAIMPQWVTLCFLKGAKLSDPKKLLRGSGNIVRNVRLSSPGHLDQRDVRALVDQAIAAANPGFFGKPGGQHTVIKSISAKQRPRRPSS